MFVNTPFFLMLIIDLASLVAGSCIIVFTLKSYIKWKKINDFKSNDRQPGKRINRAFFFITLFLLIRQLSYPLFYLSLQSFVKYVEGAMCIYGVTQLLPGLCNFLEIIKPFCFFITGLWLIFHFLTRKSMDGPLVLQKLMLLTGVCGCIILNCFVDLNFLINVDFQTSVTCCTISTDLPDRLSATIARYLFGRRYDHLLLYFYYIINFALIGTAAYIQKFRKIDKATKAAYRKKITGLVFFLALINFFLTALSIQEVIGPKLMKLPYHHCFYCLFQYVPVSCFMVTFFIFGTFGFGWAFGLEIMASGKKTIKNLPDYTKKLYQFSISCLTLSLTIISLTLLW